MPPRKRSLRNRDLTGTHIKAVKRNDKHLYYYRMPDKSLEPLGDNRANAIEAAHILNMHFRPSGDLASGILEKSTRQNIAPLDSINKLITEFQTIYLPEKKQSVRTLEEKNYKLELYRKQWGDLSASTIATRDLTSYLNTLTVNAYIKHRSLLKQLFQFAIHQGYRDNNPVLATMEKTAPTRERKKHTLEGYNAIRNISPDWLQRAIDIALLSLQRRSDLTRLHRDDVDMEKGTITIIQRKTRNYKNPVHIEINMGAELKRAVQACLSSGIPCPYLIHYRPTRTKQARLYSKDHPFSVTDDHLTKQFSKYRDLSGVYDHIPKNQRPSFHDLRGLGSYLYEKSGFASDYTQALMGHANKAMTDHYIAGHEAPLPVTVAADLSLKTEEK